MSSVVPLVPRPSKLTEFNVPERWAKLVPESVDFTVLGLLKAMVTGVIQPLYDSEGNHACDATK